MSAYFDVAIDWRAKEGCPLHTRAIIERRIASFLPTWKVPPVNGEVFEGPAQCLARLQAWAFMEGFAVIIRSNAGNKANPGKVFQCIHHDDNPQGGTRNNRELEQRVQRSSTSARITSKRQQDTFT